MSVDGQHHRVLAGRELGSGLHDRGNEEQQASRGYVFAEGDEVHLAVDGADLPIGPDEEGCVVDPLRGTRPLLLSTHLLDLVAADEQRRVPLSRQPLDGRPPDEIALEEERCRGLGPDDERGAAGQRLAGHRQVLRGDLSCAGGVPLDLLRDVRLQHRHPDRLPCLQQGRVAQPPLAPDGADGHKNHSSRTKRQAVPSSSGGEIRCGSPRPREQRGQSVDPGQARQLGNRQPRDLAVAEERPRKAVPDVLASELRGNPCRRRQQRGGGSEGPRKPAHHEGKHAGEKREVGNEQQGDDEGQRRRQPAKGRHRLDEPVEGASEVDGAGSQSQRERAARRQREISGAPGTHQRHDERRQCEPGGGRVPELWEAERQQGARQES